MLARTSYRCMLAGIVLASFAAAAQAQGNFGFLSDTPLSHLSTEDLSRLEAEVYRVRDEERDAKVTHWKSQTSMPIVEANVTPRTLRRKGTPCRRITVEMRGRGPVLILEPLYCRNAQNAWELQKIDF